MLRAPAIPTIKVSGTTSTQNNSIELLAANANAPATDELLCRPTSIYVGAACLVTFKSGDTVLMTPFRFAEKATLIPWPLADIGVVNDGLQVDIDFDSAPSSIAYNVAVYHVVDKRISHAS